MSEEAHKQEVKRHSLTCSPYTCGHEHFISQFLSLLDHHIYHGKELVNFVSVTEHYFYQCKTRGMPTQREGLHHGTKCMEPLKWGPTIN